MHTPFAFIFPQDPESGLSLIITPTAIQDIAIVKIIILSIISTFKYT